MDTRSLTEIQASLISKLTIPRTPAPGRLCQTQTSSLPEGANLVEQDPDDPAPRYVRRRVTTSEDIMKVEQSLHDEQDILELWRIQRLERAERSVR